MLVLNTHTDITCNVDLEISPYKVDIYVRLDAADIRARNAVNHMRLSLDMKKKKNSSSYQNPGCRLNIPGHGRFP